MRSVVVVGASLAGLSSARALRAAGFDGRLTLVGEEQHAPYDRPPLSKGFLLGTVTSGALALGAPDLDGDLDLRWRLGTRAIGLDTARTAVRLDTGEVLDTDGVVIATGAAPRLLLGTGRLGGVHALRTIDDAAALRDELTTPRRVVIVGCGFIGAEVASACRTLGHHVTVVEALRNPLDAALGGAVAGVARALPGEHGVDLRTGVGIGRLLGRGRVEAVELADGTRIDADLVVVGIGVLPSTGWLADSGLACENGVQTDAHGITSHPRIAAVGDVASYPSARVGRRVRVEHWTNALEMPRVAAAALLAGPAATGLPVHDPVPYFWSDQYGVKIQVAGYPGVGDRVRVVNGSFEARRFTAVYEQEGRQIGVVSFNDPKSFTTIRRELSASTADQEVA